MKFKLLLVLLFAAIGLQGVYAQSGDDQEGCLQPSSYANSFSALNLSDEEYEAVRNSAQEGAELVFLLQSPSCRYQLRVYSVPGESELVRRVVLWDTASQQPIADYLHRRNNKLTYNDWFWNPAETEVVIGQFYKGMYLHSTFAVGNYTLWNLASGFSVPLRCPVEGGCIEPSFTLDFWDDARNWLWVDSDEGVLAYDRATGEVVRSFANPPWGGVIDNLGHSYRFSSDGTKVIVIFKAGSGLNDALTIWDIDQMTSSPVNVEGWATRWTYGSPTTPMSECVTSISLSADNRYLALGDVVIRVWDMENLQPAYEDRLPIYRHEGPDARIRCLRFADANTIETQSNEGIQHWNLHTGAPAP